MENKDYEPVSCDYHDQLEAAAMHKREVRLEFEHNGVRQDERGQIADVYSRDGEEFVQFKADNGELTIRLDKIISFKEL
jgi:Rho-binding antiterminator